MNNPNYNQPTDAQRPNGKEKGELEIDLWATARSVLGRWWLILLVAVAAAAITFVIYQVVHVDTYTAAGNIYLVTNVSEKVDTSDARFAETFMNDYLKDLNDINNFKSSLSILGNTLYDSYDTSTMTEEQKKQLTDHIVSATGSVTAESLKKATTIGNDTGTHFINVTYTNEDPKLAYAGCMSILQASVERLKDFYGVEQVSIRKTPENPPAKDGSGLIRYTLIAGLAGALLVIAILAFLYIKDDKINTSEDVEEYLGLNVLAMIPLYTPEDAGNTQNGAGSGKRR